MTIAGLGAGHRRNQHSEEDAGEQFHVPNRRVNTAEGVPAPRRCSAMAPRPAG
jgi:hypothetical protein